MDRFAGVGIAPKVHLKSRKGLEAVEPQIDHLVVAARDLDEGSDYVFTTLGVKPQGGGEHVTHGTHNRVLRLGESCYLEVIAVNPSAAKPPRPRWFELDSVAVQERLKQKPLLLTWAVRTNHIEELSKRSIVPLGTVTPMSRGDLRWRLTLTDDGHLLGGGVIPFLIQWEETIHPASRMRDVGCSLVSLRGFYPQRDEILTILRSLGAEQLLSLESIASHETPRLVAQIQTPNGVSILS